MFYSLSCILSLHNGTWFHEKYITSDDKNKYIYDDRNDVFPKKVRKRYNAKYQKTYSNQYYVLKNDYIKDTRILSTYSGRKRWAKGYVYINGSQYCDAEGSSCLHDAITNAAPIIGGGIEKLE